MKLYVFILNIFLTVSVSCWGQDFSHSDKAYVSNPELARQDALNYVQSGNISNAILCYKKYAALTGKDMTAEISRLERTQYPSWYDASSMLALPMKDGSVLIVYKELKSYPAWTMPDNVTVSEVPGVWDITIAKDDFSAIQHAGLYIPGDGLYHRRIKSGFSINSTIYLKQGGRVVGTKEIPNEDESLTIYILTANGEKELDCGNYKKKGEWNGKRVILTTSDNRQNYNIYFYPTRKLRYVNGAWQIEKTTTSVNSKASSTIEY